VELGAFVVVSGSEGFQAMPEIHPTTSGISGKARPLYSSRMPILGNDVLQSWIERVRTLGVHNLWLASRPHDGNLARSLAEFARQGIERLLVIKLKSYAEMDLSDLLRFHCERRNPVTEAHDAQGRLGVSLLDQLALQGEDQKASSACTDSAQNPYQFSGYAKRILSARERQELVGDGLTGACAMRPAGTTVRDQVWIGEDASVADSARIIGPAYIGARSIVRPGATIGPFASVERDCEIDCGTTVERSTVLPNTYLAPGLLVKDGLVDGGYMEHLVWETVTDLRPAGLGRRIERPESTKRVFSAPANDGLPMGSTFAWDPSPANASQPWRQVQL
jgi:hypothetical protein